LFRDAHRLGRRDLFLIYEVQLPLHEAWFEPRMVRNRHRKSPGPIHPHARGCARRGVDAGRSRARVQSRATLRRLLAS
jgi:hypothetical protein